VLDLRPGLPWPGYQAAEKYFFNSLLGQGEKALE
jgi:hypothetical protein